MQRKRDPQCLVKSLAAPQKLQQRTEFCSAVVRRFNKGLQWAANSDYAKEKGLITPAQHAVLRQVCSLTSSLLNAAAVSIAYSELAGLSVICNSAVHVTIQDSSSVLRRQSLREAHRRSHSLLTRGRAFGKRVMWSCVRGPAWFAHV